MPRTALRAIVLPLLTGCAAAPADRQPAAPAERSLADCLGGCRAGSS